MKKLILLYFIAMLCATQLWSTIVIPPQNIAEMAVNSDLVVYGTVLQHYEDKEHLNQFQVFEVLKGDVPINSIILVEEYSKTYDDLVQDVLGDTDFSIGSNYLLFLFQTENGHYRASWLSMGVFVELVINDQQILAHEQSFQELCVLNKEEVNFDALRAAYQSIELREELYANINQSKAWSSQQAGIMYKHTEVLFEAAHTHKHHEATGSINEKAACPNPVPSHCTVMSGTPNGTGPNAPSKFESNIWTVQVPSVAQNDPSINNHLSHLQTAVATLNDLPGINMTYAGIDASANSINCNDPTASIQSWAGVNINNAYVVFDDPCSGIPPLLPNCGGGFLGFGGGFTYSVTNTDACGKVWRDRRYPFLVLNDGIGCYGVYNYITIITHELIHGLGINHINGSCTALMNASLCLNSNAPNFGITALDEACVDWMYNAGVSTPTNISISPKVFLQGCWDGVDLSPTLGQANLIPQEEPYGLDNKISNISKANIVDWVVVQIRAAGNNEMVLEEQTALLRSDGTVVDADGTSALVFNLAPGNYHVAIKHRNHLSIMTENAIPLN